MTDPTMARIVSELGAERDRLRALLFKIQCEQLSIACNTSMTRKAMREGAMETRNEIMAALTTGDRTNG